MTAKHNLGVEGAKQQITERYETLKQTVKIDRVGEAQMTWIDDTAQVSAKALGQRAQARIDVAETLITIHRATDAPRAVRQSHCRLSRENADALHHHA